MGDVLSQNIQTLTGGRAGSGAAPTSSTDSSGQRLGM
jgi:hypothetical protein